MQEFDEINPKKTKELTKEILIAIGKNIKERRSQGKLSQLDVAFFTYTEKSFISNLENGKLKNITLLTLLKLSELFKIPIEEIFKGRD